MSPTAFTLGDFVAADKQFVPEAGTWTCYDHYVVVPKGEQCPDCVAFIERNAALFEGDGPECPACLLPVSWHRQEALDRCGVATPA